MSELQRGVRRDENFRFLYDTYYRPLQGFLAKRLASPEDRFDLTQEVFLRVYKGLRDYRGEAQFGTWVFRIARNTHLKWLRRAQNRDATSGGNPDHEDPGGTRDNDEQNAVSDEKSPLDRVLTTERKEELRAAIDKLPEQMRQCTQLRVYRDLSYREIAVLLRRSIETVKVHLFQARKKLRHVLGELEL